MSLLEFAENAWPKTKRTCLGSSIQSHRSPQTTADRALPEGVATRRQHFGFLLVAETTFVTNLDLRRSLLPASLTAHPVSDILFLLTLPVTEYFVGYTLPNSDPMQFQSAVPASYSRY